MNKQQKRALLKKRHQRQQYLKLLNRLEALLRGLGATDQCEHVRNGTNGNATTISRLYRCIKTHGHAGIHEARNDRDFPMFWSSE